MEKRSCPGGGLHEEKKKVRQHLVCDPARIKMPDLRLGPNHLISSYKFGDPVWHILRLGRTWELVVVPRLRFSKF